MIDRVFEELKVPRQIRIEVGQSETAYSFVASRAGVAVVDPISAFTNRDARRSPSLRARRGVRRVADQAEGGPAYAPGQGEPQHRRQDE